MQKINIVSGTMFQHIRALVLGRPSSGKTHFAATAPDPLFISDAAEGGYKMLYEMDPIYWWNPKKAPAVWVVDNIFADMPKILAELEQMAQAKQFPFKTIVFDPVSIYTDRFIAEELLREPGKDNRQVYGNLANHLRAIVLRFHAMPAHVFWLSHLKPAEGDNNGAAIAGQMGEKFPALCDFKWLTNVNTVPGKPPQFELRTLPFRSWTFLGGRGKRLPDPMVPSFKCVAEVLGVQDKPLGPAVPGFPDGCSYAQFMAENHRPIPVMPQSAPPPVAPPAAPPPAAPVVRVAPPAIRPAFALRPPAGAPKSS
jgi:hypothetical protein